MKDRNEAKYILRTIMDYVDLTNPIGIAFPKKAAKFKEIHERLIESSKDILNLKREVQELKDLLDIPQEAYQNDEHPF